MRAPDLLSDPVHRDEDAARACVEEVRWPDGPFCPQCEAFDTVKPLGGPSMGTGWYCCSACQDKFTVRVGSIFERSHIPLPQVVARLPANGVERASKKACRHTKSTGRSGS